MQLGMVGLGRMGANMTRRLMRGGHSLVVSDLSADAVKQLGTEGATGSSSLEDLIAKLTPPRAVWIMVPSGAPTEATVQKLAAAMQKGDAIIDGGNSLFTDSNRRTKDLATKGLLYIGSGVSGGEEGARFGPSIMPGGDPAAWPAVKPIFQGIAAKVEDGTPCCDWVGEGGADVIGRHPRLFLCGALKWGGRGSNPRPTNYESHFGALPTCGNS